jgi:hypothetical protein
MGGDRPGTRKNFVINSESGVSFKIKPSRVLRGNEDSENKQGLLEEQETEQQDQKQEEEPCTSHHTPAPLENV